MAGHHARHTLGVVDEASGVPDNVFTQMDTWAGGGALYPRKRQLIFGNCMQPVGLFYQECKAGDLLAKE